MPRKMKESGVEWLGQIPEGWGLGRVKNDFVHVKSIAGIGAGSYDRLALTMQGVVKRSKDDTVGLQPQEFESYQVLRPNELVFKLIDLQNVKTSRVGRSSFEGIVSPAYIVLHPRSEQNSKYAEYFFLALWMHEIFQTMGGDAVRSCLTAADLLNIQLPRPPCSEQERIAAFLDERCAKIDGMISEAKTSIEDYRKWKQSLIENVTLKGVGSAPLAAVSSDWVEQVPAHWRFMQIRYLLELRDERNEKPLSEVNLISLYTDKGVVQHCDLEKTTGNKAATADGYKLVYEDDIVVNIILCWMGAIGRSAYAGVTSPAYDVYRVKRQGEVLPRYYHYLFRTTAFSGACYRRGRGIMMMRWRTYSDEFRSIKVPVPSYAEQEQIANYLDEKCAAIDKLVGEKESLIADLEAYKKSLIFETVTGKREVA